jgi:hypothetical protein
MATLVAAWGLFGAALAQPRPDVTLWIPGDSVTTGEPFALTIESSTPAHRGIAFPPATTDTAFGELEVLGRSDVYTRRVGAGYAIDSVSYTVRTSARDSVRIPRVPIRVDVAVGTLTTFTLPRTVKVQAARESALPNPFGWDASGRLPWLVLALVVGGALYGVAHLWRERRDESPARDTRSSEPPSPPGDADADPYDAATAQLRELEARNWTDPATVEAVHVALADVVRTYLSRQLDIATEERTTEDLLALLDRRSDVPADAIEPLRTALEQADRVKFAAARPAPAAVEDTIEAARSALDRLEDTFHPVPPSHDAGRPSE